MKIITTLMRGMMRQDTDIKILVRNNNVEKAIRQLKKKVMKDGLLKELKRRQFYEKPSLKRQRKAKEGLKRLNKLRRLQERLNDH